MPSRFLDIIVTWFKSQPFQLYEIPIVVPYYACGFLNVPYKNYLYDYVLTNYNMT